MVISKWCCTIYLSNKKYCSCRLYLLTGSDGKYAPIFRMTRKVHIHSGIVYDGPTWYENDKLDCIKSPWWRHQMETFSAQLAICAGNSPVPGEFPAQRPVTRSLDVFFDLRLNKRLSKQSWGWWYETLWSPLWRHCNVQSVPLYYCLLYIWYALVLMTGILKNVATFWFRILYGIHEFAQGLTL